MCVSDTSAMNDIGGFGTYMSVQSRQNCCMVMGVEVLQLTMEPSKNHQHLRKGLNGQSSG